MARRYTDRWSEPTPPRELRPSALTRLGEWIGVRGTGRRELASLSVLPPETSRTRQGDMAIPSAEGASAGMIGPAFAGTSICGSLVRQAVPRGVIPEYESEPFHVTRSFWKRQA